MRLVKRFTKQILLTAALGFVVHKLMSADDPRAQRIGQGANKLVGGAFGPDESAMPEPRKRTSIVARSAATAAAGAAMSYFFDPVHGSERRAKVKSFASEHLRLGGERPRLPAPEQFRTGVPTQAIAPGVPS